MNGCVLDCSVVVPFFLRDESTAYSEAVRHLSLSAPVLAAPALLPFELANTVLQASRRQRCTVGDAAAFLDAVLALGLSLYPADDPDFMRLTHRLAAHYNLSAYDAAYLATALFAELPLATQDKALRQAALAEGCFLDPLN